MTDSDASHGLFVLKESRVVLEFPGAFFWDLNVKQWQKKGSEQRD